MFKYDSEEKISRLVSAFETATIARDDWGHAEHLVVAAYYCSRFDRKTAFELMREGILGLLVAGFGLDLTREMPYHETLTVFWMDAVRHFLENNPDRPLPRNAERLVEELGKDFPLTFYERETLFSDNARTEFVPPRTPFPWDPAGDQ